MSQPNIMVRDFLGKYYTELLHSVDQEKYKNCGLDCFFDQSFSIQGNKTQMVVDPRLEGLSVIFCGNEIHVSQEMHNLDAITLTNSIDIGKPQDTRNLYNPSVIQTLAYLACQNHTTLTITKTIEQPIYISYKSEFETFYNSVTVINLSPGIEVDIVEEIESLSALNVVANYIVNPTATLHIKTFYKNNIIASSMFYRNIMAQDNAMVTHALFGTGSTNVIDETRIRTGTATSVKMIGIRNSRGMNFHSILYVDPMSPTFRIDVVYKDILWDDASVTFFPVLKDVGAKEGSATIEVSDVNLNQISESKRLTEVHKLILETASEASIEGTVGVDRFNTNKIKFLSFK